MRILQLVPSLHVGGVERGVQEVDSALHHVGYGSYVASAGGPLARRLSGCHLCGRTLSYRNPLCVLLLNPLLLAYWVRRHRISVLHARSRCLAASALVACLIAPGTKLVVTWHGFYSSGSLPRWLFNGLLLLADRLILPSAFIRAHVRAQYVHATTGHWRMVHRGVAQMKVAGRCANETACPEKGLDETAIVLLPGRLSASKGQDSFLAALQLLRERPPLISADGRVTEVVGRMVGAKESCGGRYSARVRAAVEEARRGGAKVSLEPHTAEIAQAYHDARVVVVPSRRAEAFGRVLLEALSASRLVVAFQHGAVGELASLVWEEGRRTGADEGMGCGMLDDEGGSRDRLQDELLSWSHARQVGTGVLLMGAVLLVGCGDVPGLANAIEAAATMPASEREWRTRRASAAARKRFSLQAFTDRTLDVYREVHAVAESAAPVRESATPVRVCAL